MLREIDDYDWQQVFAFATDYSTQAVLGSRCSTKGFGREDVVKIFAMRNGENEGQSWVGVFQLKDGRYAYLTAGCCYSGWDVQSAGDVRVAETLEQIISLAMTESERQELINNSDRIYTI